MCLYINYFSYIAYSRDYSYSFTYRALYRKGNVTVSTETA